MKRNNYSVKKGYMKVKLNMLLAALLACNLSLVTSSCDDILDTESELVEFQEDNTLNHTTDSVYNLMGIIYRLQNIADRTLLLGEIRGDLVTPTDYASADLKAVANFTSDAQSSATASNAYNQISDYYAVINNCNYYLAKVDTALEKRGRKVFEAEYAAVKAYRAWTYLQTALVYGNIPLITTPVLSISDAEIAINGKYMGIEDICNYFIDDLRPYVDTKLPTLGSINGLNSQKFFIPVRALLGDLCLWAGRYQEAATFYHDYLTLRTDPIPTGLSLVQWNSETNEFRLILDGYSTQLMTSSGAECLCFLPMEASEYEGVYSQIVNVFSSTLRNNYYAQAKPSKACKQLFSDRDYCFVFAPTEAQRDTIYAPKDNVLDAPGDLRLYASYRERIENQDQNSRYSSERQTLYKLNEDGITLYRRQIVYLRFAEALNRAGYPQSAFAVLKYGLYQQSIAQYIDAEEREAAAELLTFDSNVFTESNTIGIHSRGCGDSRADKGYVIPKPDAAQPTRQDTIACVENLIIQEMALETAFEGQRYYDLMRVALRRHEPSYLAKPVASRNGETDQQLLTLLSDTSNWYLKK